jgi:hypothetical protein
MCDTEELVVGRDPGVQRFPGCQIVDRILCWGWDCRRLIGPRKVTFNNGTNVSGGLTAGIGNVFDTTGDGFSNPSHNPNQIGYIYVGGVITPYDLSRGSIDHALRVALSPNDEAMPSGAPYATSSAGTYFTSNMTFSP